MLAIETHNQSFTQAIHIKNSKSRAGIIKRTNPTNYQVKLRRIANPTNYQVSETILSLSQADA